MKHIRAYRGVLQKDECICKILRTLQPKYATMVLVIEDLRIRDKMDVSLNSLVGNLTTFELRKFDKSQLPKVETTLKASVVPTKIQKGKEEASTSKYKRELKSLYVEELEQEELEGLLVKMNG